MSLRAVSLRDRKSSGNLPSPLLIKLDNLGDKRPSVAVLAILHLHPSEPGQLVGRERHKVFILGRLVGVLYEHVDVLLHIVLLDGNDVDEIGVLEDLGRLEGSWEGGAGGAALAVRARGRSQRQQRQQGREDREKGKLQFFAADSLT